MMENGILWGKTGDHCHWSSCRKGLRGLSYDRLLNWKRGLSSEEKVVVMLWEKSCGIGRVKSHREKHAETKRNEKATDESRTLRHKTNYTECITDRRDNAEGYTDWRRRSYLLLLWGLMFFELLSGSISLSVSRLLVFTVFAPLRPKKLIEKW